MANPLYQDPYVEDDDGPLSQFQATTFKCIDNLKLVHFQDIFFLITLASQIFIAYLAWPVKIFVMVGEKPLFLYRYIYILKPGTSYDAIPK